MILIPLKSLLKLETYFVYHLAQNVLGTPQCTRCDPHQLMRLVWCLSDILAIASLSFNLGKLSPNQPMIVFAPPYPGPPLFVAHKSRVPLYFDMCQGIQCLKRKAERNMSDHCEDPQVGLFVIFLAKLIQSISYLILDLYTLICCCNFVEVKYLVLLVFMISINWLICLQYN